MRKHAHAGIRLLVLCQRNRRNLSAEQIRGTIRNSANPRNSRKSAGARGIQPTESGRGSKLFCRSTDTHRSSLMSIVEVDLDYSGTQIKQAYMCEG